MVLYYGDLAATPTYFSPWKDFTAGLRGLFLICRKTWPLLMSYNGPNGPLSIYYKSAIFICFHQAFHDRLPVTLIDLISKKRATNYSTRTCASLIVPGFNTCYFSAFLRNRFAAKI